MPAILSGLFPARKGRSRLALVIALLLTFFSLRFLSGCSGGGGTLHFLDFRVAPTPGPAAVLYGRILNQMDENLTIEKIESPEFASVEVHNSRETDGQIHMETMRRVSIPAGSALEMRPGGIHIMLMNPPRRMKVGEIVHLKLTINHRAYDLEAVVRDEPE